MATNHLDLHADRLAEALETGPLPTARPSPRDLTLLVAGLVRRHGAAEALGTIRLTLGALPDYHDTRTTFMVWAVDRLLAAGLSTTALLWHPLTAPGSELAWWDAATLASPEAARRFVPATRTQAGDPEPSEPRANLPIAV